MKSILMSIRPQWCEKIFNGSKTIEVRKSRPSIPTPFKVYVYETKGKTKYWSQPMPIPYTEGRGKVIGSFVCDKVEEIMVKADCATTNGEHWKLLKIAKEACLSKQELKDYIRVGESGYGWHITSPKLFDKPRELGEFFDRKGEPIKRAFQSWGYCYGQKN